MCVCFSGCISVSVYTLLTCNHSRSSFCHHGPRPGDCDRRPESSLKKNNRIDAAVGLNPVGSELIAPSPFLEHRNLPEEVERFEAPLQTLATTTGLCLIRRGHTPPLTQWGPMASSLCLSTFQEYGLSGVCRAHGCDESRAHVLGDAGNVTRDGLESDDAGALVSSLQVPGRFCVTDHVRPAQRLQSHVRAEPITLARGRGHILCALDSCCTSGHSDRLR